MDNFYIFFGTQRKITRRGLYEMDESEIEMELSGEIDNILILAENKLKVSDVKSALTILSEGSRNYPQSGFLWAASGFIYSFIANHNSALNNFKEALSVGGDNYIIYSEIGNCLNALSKFEKAEEAFTIAINLKPIINYTERGFLERRIKILKTKEGYEILFSNRAMSRLMLDNYDGCISDCARAKKVNPNFPGYKLALGIMFHKLGKSNEALGLIKEAAISGYLPAKAILQQFFGIS